MSRERETGTKEARMAPLVVFGAMIAMALTGILLIFINHCQREEPYLDPTPIRPGDPAGVQLPPPPSPSPQ